MTSAADDPDDLGFWALVAEDWRTHHRRWTQPGFRALFMYRFGRWRMGIEPRGYATDGSPGFPVFHAAALDRPGSVKGGPYSGGTFPGFGQYGVIDITDDGERLEVELTGKNWKGEVLISEVLRFPAAQP